MYSGLTNKSTYPPPLFLSSASLPAKDYEKILEILGIPLYLVRQKVESKKIGY